MAKHNRKLTCDKCKQEKNMNDSDVVYSRGHYWHLPCTRVLTYKGRQIVNFPSDGKLIPKTIMTEGI